MLAALTHAALFAFLWFGVRWQNETPVAVEAEVWDTQIRQAAPKAVAVPIPVPVEKPVIKPIPKVVETPVEKPAAPDIALEQEKKRKAKLEKIKEEKAKAETKRLQQEAQDKAQKVVNKKTEDKEKKKELTKQQQVKDAAEQAKIDREHAANMARITGTAGTGGTGDAAKSTGPRGDPTYGAAIKIKIKSNISYGGDTDVPGNPRAVFKIDQLPNGEIIGVKKLKSSGIPAFDDAVENAIRKSTPLPRKKDGTVDREIEATFNLKE